MNLSALILVMLMQTLQADIREQIPLHPGSIVIVTNSSTPKGIDELSAASKPDVVRELAKKNGYDVFDKHKGLFVFEPSVMNLKELKLRCDLIKRLGALSAVPYWAINSSQFGSPEVAELLKCFAGDKDFTGQERNQNAKLSVRCDFNLILTDGNKSIEIKDPTLDNSFSDCYFKVDPSLNHEVPAKWQTPRAFEPCPVDLSKITVRVKASSTDTRSQLHLLDDVNAVIAEQIAPYLRTMDEADSIVDNAFRGDEDIKVGDFTKFSDLPDVLKARLTKYVEDNYRELGLQNPGDSTEYLRKMRVKSTKPRLFVVASMVLPNGGRKTGRVQICLGGK